MRHPLHAPLVHLPLGLLTATSLCDALTWLMHSPLLAAVARTNLLIGLVASLPALGAGLLDLRRLPRDDRTIVRAMWHVGVMVSAIGLYFTSYLMRLDAGRLGPASAVGGVGLVALVFGGYMGGELVHQQPQNS